MWTTIWENVEQEVIDALTITGKDTFKILPKDQFEAIYKYRTIVYDGDTLRNRFHIILTDNLHIVYTIKNLKIWLQKLIDHNNWAKITKTIETTDGGGITTSVSQSNSSTKDESMSLGYSMGNNKTDGGQKLKSGYTDANSLGDAETQNKKFLTFNEEPEKDEYPNMRGFNASNELSNNAINDIGLQLNKIVNNMNATSTSNSTGLNKNTNKADSIQLVFRTADDLIAIINMKIPELRKMFFSKFDVLFSPITIY